MAAEEDDGPFLNIVEGPAAAALGEQVVVASSARDTTALLRRITHDAEAHRLELVGRQAATQQLLAQWGAANAVVPLRRPPAVLQQRSSPTRRRPSTVAAAAAAPVRQPAPPPPPAEVDQSLVALRASEAEVARLRGQAHQYQSDVQRCQAHVAMLQTKLAAVQTELVTSRQQLEATVSACEAAARATRRATIEETKAVLADEWQVRAAWLWTLFVAEMARRSQQLLESKAVDSLMNTLPGLIGEEEQHTIRGGAQLNHAVLQEGLQKLQLLVEMAHATSRRAAALAQVVSGLPEDARRELQAAVVNLPLLPPRRGTQLHTV